jgi:zinc finger protein
MVDTLEGQQCPVCGEKKLVLTEDEKEIPFFGKVYLFSMTCHACKYHKADVESVEEKEPSRFTLEISSEEDMKIRVVRSSMGTIKIPHIASIEPGETATGYVTNVEGILNRIKHQIEVIRDTEEDEDAKKKAKNLLKKLTRIIWGQEKSKLIIEDPTGNSAIISDKAEKTAMKK